MTTAADGIAKLKKLISIAKAVDPASLDDIDIIDAVSENGPKKTTVPTAAEYGIGPDRAARGGDAQRAIHRYSNLAPQEAIAAMYDEVDSRFGAFEKALSDIRANLAKAQGSINTGHTTVRDLLASLTKADPSEEEEKKKEDDDMEKALRRAGFAVRKAEDSDKDDEDEDYKKAEKALGDAKVALTKAEDDADDEKDEDKVKKARGRFRTLKSDLAKIKTDREAAKAAVTKAVEPDKTEVKPAAEVQKAEDPEKAALLAEVAEMRKSLAALEKGNPTTPPMFSSETTGETMTGFLVKAQEKADSGLLSDVALAKAHSIVGRLRAAKAGSIDFHSVETEIAKCDPDVRSIFTTAA